MNLQSINFCEQGKKLRVLLMAHRGSKAPARDPRECMLITPPPRLCILAQMRIAQAKQSHGVHKIYSKAVEYASHAASRCPMRANSAVHSSALHPGHRLQAAVALQHEGSADPQFRACAARNCEASRVLPCLPSVWPASAVGCPSLALCFVVPDPHFPESAACPARDEHSRCFLTAPRLPRCAQALGCTHTLPTSTLFTMARPCM